jgi:DNA-binding NarL/FixJ family response regulator
MADSASDGCSGSHRNDGPAADKSGGEGPPAAGQRDTGAHCQAVLAEEAEFLAAPLAELLETGGVDVVAMCTARDMLVPLVAAWEPDVAVIDLSDDHTVAALAAARDIRNTRPGTGVVVLAEHVSTEGIVELLRHGGAGVGYLLKDRIREGGELIGCVHAVAAGGSRLDPEVLTSVARATPEDDQLASLTPREEEVLGLLAEGLTNDAIADRLVVTKRATEKHVTNIFCKLGLHPDRELHRRVRAALLYERTHR